MVAPICAFSQKALQHSDVTHGLVDEAVACVAAVQGLVVAAAATAVHRHTSRQVEVAGALRILLGHLQADLPRPAHGALDLLHDDWKGRLDGTF